MTVSSDIVTSTGGSVEAAGQTSARARAPVVIEASGVSKSFRIRDQRVDTLKERVSHPFTRATYHDLHALRNVSFEVRRGEFFGIVGRNGSGKSTLLKILASIYRPDSGRVRMAGSMSPFIELGVGFNPELTSRENCVLNGVLMGLSRREAARRFDAVLDFSELRDYVDLKIKNYSSGMMVRLAFSIMVQADADIMLIDEVLAVGDAAFAQKCMDVFYERRERGRTLVLVTHDMATVQSLCHRALVIHDGESEFCGGPAEAALRYLRLNFAHTAAGGTVITPEAPRGVRMDVNVTLDSACLRNEAGERVSNLETGVPIRLDATLRAAKELPDPGFEFRLHNEEGVVLAAFERHPEGPVRPGQLITLRGEIENRLVPGRYTIECWVRRTGESGEIVIQAVRLAQFLVYGTGSPLGLVRLETDLDAVLQEDP